MRRREFAALIGGAAIARPGIGVTEVLVRHPLVVVLMQRSPEAMERYVVSFTQGLQELGLVPGRDFELDQRSANGEPRRVPELLTELIGLTPSVIVTSDTALTLAAKRATKVIPIVGVAISAPVAFGLVASLARPGGNVTGLLSSVDRLVPKQLELLLQILPGTKRIAVLFNATNPANAAGARLLESDTAARSLELVPAGRALRTRSRLRFRLSLVIMSRRYSYSRMRCLPVMPNGLRHWPWQRGSRRFSASASPSKPAG